jgi:hypothetical protein
MTANKIFRFKLSDEIMELITQFAKTYQHADRHAYKEAWQQWTTNQQEIVGSEIARLKHLGYDGDVLDKMFKAGRYYFRSKTTTPAPAPAPAALVKTDDGEKRRRGYYVLNPDILRDMDAHITAQMNQHDFKPAKGFDQFCEHHKDLLRREIARLIQIPIATEKIAEKIKKTYKNRYFILSQH